MTIKYLLLIVLYVLSLLGTYAEPSSEAKVLVTQGWKSMTASPPNYEQAMSSNMLAFEQGHPEGAANIGMLYEYGWGVEKNASIAANWYTKAIEMGKFRSAQANYQLAGLYENGLGVDKNLDRAKAHYSESLGISTGAYYSDYISFKDEQRSRDALDRINSAKQLSHLVPKE